VGRESLKDSEEEPLDHWRTQLNTLVVVQHPAIREAPSIENVSRHFSRFAFFVTTVNVPLSVGVNWIPRHSQYNLRARYSRQESY
jgi:hypothetical protein